MAGKYTPGGDVKAEPGRRANFDFPPIDKDKADRIVVAMRDDSQSPWRFSGPRRVLAWVRQKPFITSTIIGAQDTGTAQRQSGSGRPSHLSPEEIAKLDDDQRRPAAISALDDQAANNSTRVADRRTGQDGAGIRQQRV